MLYLFAGAGAGAGAGGGGCGWFQSNTRLKSRTGPQNPMELDYI